MPTPPTERPGVFISETLTALPGTTATAGAAIGCFAAAYNRGPITPTFVSSWNQYISLFGNFTVSGNSLLPYAVYQFFNNGGAGCYVIRVPNNDATTASLILVDINSPTDNVLTVNANSPGVWANQMYVAITSAGNTGRFNFSVYLGGNAPSNLVENFIDLSINPADPRNVANVVNSAISGSNFVTVTPTLPGNVYSPGLNDPALISPTLLSGGNDGIVAPSLSSSLPVQLDKLQGQILNLNLPGVTDPTTLNSLISYASGRADVMMIIDGPTPTPPETSAQVVNNYVNMVAGGTPLTASTYATLYAPWIQVPDPASSMPNATIWLPPGGAVSGIWSRTDTLVGAHQSPAGIQYGQINLVDVEVRFTSADLDTLNSNNINAIRFVPGYFPAVMGARTLQQGYPSRYLSVRRELIKLEHDFTFLLQFALFLPNDADLWAQVTQILENYLTEQLQSGAIAGNTAVDAFSVVCDSSNNLPSTAQAGIVNASVGVALLSPAEFIIINISQFQSTGTTTTTTSV